MQVLIIVTAKRLEAAWHMGLPRRLLRASSSTHRDDGDHPIVKPSQILVAC